METRLSVPLIVGVTGHRDLRPEDIAKIEDCVGSVFDDFEQRCPHTTIILLSALAAGADTLAARVAMQRGIGVIACLPYELDLHLQQFDEAGRVEQRSLLAKCLEVRIAPYKHVSEVEAYARNGRYVSDNSNVLITVWDGIYDDKRGGTADIVKYRLEGARPEDASFPRLYSPETASVYKVACHRFGSAEPSPNIRVERLLPLIPRMPSKDVREIDDQTLTAIDQLNADLSSIGPTTPANGNSSLLQAADFLANRYQQKTLRLLIWVYVLTFVAASAQTICIQQYANSPWQMINSAVKILSIGAAALVFLLTRRAEYESRYQDYRTLAEGLRVQAAWRAAGLSQSVDREMRTEQGELQWIRSVLRTVHFLDRRPMSVVPAPRVAVEWVEGQAAFYAKASARDDKNQRKFESIARMLTILVGVVGALVGGLLGVGSLHWPPLTSHLSVLQTFVNDPHNKDLLYNTFPALIALGALSGALVLRYAENRGFKSNAGSYARMYRLFNLGESRLKRLDTDQPSARTIIYELGKVALAEHTGWLASRRERPITSVRAA